MAAPKLLTEAEYLALEEVAGEKHELIDGRVFAMAGAGGRHNGITFALGVAVNSQLEGSPCRPYGSDARLRLDDRNYVYPDLVVACGDSTIEESNSLHIDCAKVVFEVTSPTTEVYDRGAKRLRYMAHDCLQALVIVSSESPLVEVIERQAGGGWTFAAYADLDAVCTISNPALSLPLHEIYKRVSFPQPLQTEDPQ